MIAEQPSSRSEEEVLLAFSIEPTHDRKTLEKYLTDYPEHAQALIACSIELMVDATRTDEVVGTSEQAVDRAWQRFQSVINETRGSSVANPFATLNPTALRSLAKKLDITNLLLIRLRDRAIDAATIPRRFVQRLATELETTTDAVTDYLRNPPAMVSGHSFRSAVKPTVTEQISFEKAVETSQLTHDQQQALKALQD
ncbi:MULTISPECIES: hypothetical protein [unclassified Paraburkholderia]|uniref:hypothetical protein n=1 Tax=unclassified Paraburkholderia TaxID=2615204 RepID=UPI0016188569|nr:MULTISPECIES: hypothetical protein [unclassified Paraburkholderia]MBB5442713.1 hypothetical protein [Paraburkholderia sp. WSM4177]MBB5482480.1 hypothetical protein [Paraburkholderia sp. WSM4180]